MNYYPHHIGDFNNATRHLTRVERMLYRDAIELYYDTESELTLDFNKLARKLLAITDDEKEALKVVLDDFFIITDTGYYHERCNIEITKYHSNTSNKAKAGIASALARQQKATETNGCSTDVQLTNNQEPVTNNHKPIKYIPPIPAELLYEWKRFRKSKPVTERVFTEIEKQSKIAGITSERAIEICCENGWAGFKADWIKDKINKPMKGHGFISDADFKEWLEPTEIKQERIAL